MIDTVINKELGIQYPIFQGGMAWVADASLASGVSNAGGLGIIAAMNSNGEQLRAEIKKCKEMTDKPFGVNIMLLGKNVEELAALVAEKRVPVVTTGAGTPRKYIPLWKLRQFVFSDTACYNQYQHMNNSCQYDSQNCRCHTTEH